jgi:hypothetical protein
MEAIEHWPNELRGVPPIETLTSGDGTKRVQFADARMGRCISSRKSFGDAKPKVRNIGCGSPNV